MTDKELIARLRSGLIGVDVDRRAADRIEALTAENAKLHDHIEGVAKNTHKIMVGYEAKLAKAEAGLREIVGECGCFIACAALAEIKGESQ